MLNRVSLAMNGEILTRDAEIKRLQDLLFSMGAMKDAPCFCCGYNGPGYYNPEVHQCAARHHAAAEKEGTPC